MLCYVIPIIETTKFTSCVYTIFWTKYIVIQIGNSVYIVYRLQRGRWWWPIMLGISCYKVVMYKYYYWYRFNITFCVYGCMCLWCLFIGRCVEPSHVTWMYVTCTYRESHALSHIQKTITKFPFIGLWCNINIILCVLFDIWNIKQIQIVYM